MAKKDLFYSVFAGEYVQLFSNLFINQNETYEDRQVSQEHPITFEGYLLEIDDNFYYLGETDKEISQAIERQYIVRIAVGQEENELSAVVSNGVAPEDMN